MASDRQGGAASMFPWSIKLDRGVLDTRRQVLSDGVGRPSLVDGSMRLHQGICDRFSVCQMDGGATIVYLI